jgi:endoplasmic reticulum Man9GlcNAc2 1,2-alpha-mannosidase
LLPFTGSRTTTSYHHSSGTKTYSKDPRLWAERREAVKEVFKTTWAGYEKYAWGLDEYHPISKSGRNMVEGGMGWIIVDSLDTAILMNLTSEVARAREWISTSLSYTADHDVNTFETTIRMLGGLLSAYYLSTTYPHLAPQLDDDTLQPGEDLYIEKATDLADRLLGAYDTTSGVPLSSINLNTSQGIGAQDGLASTAEAATLQLEMKHLSKLTGEPVYWQRSEQIIKVIDDQMMEDGLVPIFIHPGTGTFRSQNIRLGSRGDSYYEYLIKQFLQTNGAEPIYKEMWDEVMLGIKRHLITWTKHSNLCIIGERASGLNHDLTPKMDHLVAFMPGTIALGLTNGSTVAEAKARLGPLWTKQHDEDLRLAEELMKTFWGMYKVTPTGLAPEISYFHIDDPPRRWDLSDPDFTAPYSDDLDDHAPWRLDYDIHANDVHNLQRPETVESLFYMYHITGDPMYREWGWEMFESFREHTAVTDLLGDVYAYTSLGTVMDNPVRKNSRRDNMESFWLAETLKYFYLLFSELDGNDGLFRLEDVVINTEAHILPRFGIEGSKVWKTGWERKARGGWVGAKGYAAEGEKGEQKPVGLGGEEKGGDGHGGGSRLERKQEASGPVIGEPVGVGMGGDATMNVDVNGQGKRLEQKIAEMAAKGNGGEGIGQWEDKEWSDEKQNTEGIGAKKGEAHAKERTVTWGEGSKLADRDKS